MIAREPRYPTHSSIILTARGFGRHFVVENVSKSGAGLVGEKRLRVGEPVTLNLRGKRIDGTVRWVSNRKAGVAFKDPLDDTAFKSLINLPTRAETGQTRMH